jgi:hypothetical protein
MTHLLARSGAVSRVHEGQTLTQLGPFGGYPQVVLWARLLGLGVLGKV